MCLPISTRSAAAPPERLHLLMVTKDLAATQSSNKS